MQTPEDVDVIIFENVCQINNYEYEYICVFMLIYLDVQMYDSFKALFHNLFHHAFCRKEEFKDILQLLWMQLQTLLMLSK